MTTDLFGVERQGAAVSDCGRYRYHLWRAWGTPGEDRPMGFVMLNPSTADASVDDPTIRRCVGFAKREGCTAINVVNLFAWRATDPGVLSDVVDPVGPGNHNQLEQMLDVHQILDVPLVVAWGASGPSVSLMAREGGRLLGRALFRRVPLWCLGRTKHGHPRHPLYVRGDQPLIPFGGPT